MPTFCRKPQVASFYSSLKQPYTILCHRQTMEMPEVVLISRQKPKYLHKTEGTFKSKRSNYLYEYAGKSPK